ncbi:GNAT family N-acetyltransferase [Tahibacter amnicola]|uniref:GNAT family N-acetyltransferase n=1 Tax=Tahibacter amnicola TaxID=2976241 RepID=A0ABY6BC97_9GAMM|nr:GNAT family N-acetyltransferase [Tahibacter amnicola]UXI67470.1 GNAT family N-acetyltransferase [Tahibacter amnicola]
MITYRTDCVPDIATARALYRSCSLGARRPIDDDARFGAMLANANLTVTAWDGDQLVGISRSMTDYGFTTYLADLAVSQTYQRLGIGKELIRLTQAAAPEAKIVLLAAPAAVDYYPHIGFDHHASAWLLSGPLR